MEDDLVRMYRQTKMGGTCESHEVRRTVSCPIGRLLRGAPRKDAPSGETTNKHSVYQF